MPVWKQKYRPLTWPRPIGRMSPAAIPLASKLHGGDGVVGHAERAGEDVGAAAGKDAERGVGAGDAGGDLVERSVAAEPDHDVDASPSGVLREPDGVAAAVGLDHLHLVALRQRAVHDDRVAGRHR